MSGLLKGWRGLAGLWAAVLLLVGLGGGVLQILGPPPVFPLDEHPVLAQPSVPAGAENDVDRHPAIHAPATEKAPDESKALSSPAQPGRATPGPVADPDPAMLEPFADAPGLRLPRIAIDGRAPMSAYAAGFDPSSVRPRVGILIAGIGMSEADSLAAVKMLPGGVTLAVSPYAGDITHLLSIARMTEHEYLLSVPMEPRGYPVNDPDDRYALMTSLTAAENLSRLQEILTRVAGYVGVTNALGEMHGERLAGMPDLFDTVLEEVGRRGLLFLDARTGQPLLARAWNRSADMILDTDPTDAAVLDQRLDALTHLALDKGSALGVISVPRPVALERVAAWTNTLASKGVALAPVSALVLPPVKQASEK